MTTNRLTLDVTVYGLAERNGGMEFGLQSTTGDLLAGAPTEDGGHHYTCEANTTVRGDGTTGYRGDYIHGPTSERFLYVSARRPGDDTWARRLKIMLPGRVDEPARRLTARVRDERRARAAFVTDWTTA